MYKILDHILFLSIPQKDHQNKEISRNCHSHEEPKEPRQLREMWYSGINTEHHRLDGHGFGWTPGVGDGQGGLACCGSWGCKESDTTEQLN